MPMASRSGWSRGSSGAGSRWLSLALILASLLPTAPSNTQETGQKSVLRPRSQQLGPAAVTQGSRGQKAGDQVLLYRFRLDADSLGSELIITNSSDSVGSLALFAQ